jgi:cell division protein FtsI (penicillin-binding protein 3)
MALKPPTPEQELRLHRRVLFLTLLILPLLAALYGFASMQLSLPQWPQALAESPRRGAILAADGTILAEGSVENRRYPQGTLAAHLVGFSGAVQPDGRFGLEGLELTLDSRLQRGETVTLTIDPTIQAVAQAELRTAIEAHQALSGTVVMIEAGTGRILAAASYPEFDPNRQREVRDRSRLVNKAFLEQLEPGSTFKTFVIAALLEAGRLAPNEVLTLERALRVGGQTFRDVIPHDQTLSVAEILRYSSNIGLIRLAQRFSPEELHDWLRRFGFGREVGLRHSFTRRGAINPWTSWVPQDQASVAIGQSLSTTTLQLAVAYSIFANDGLLVPPRLLEDEPWDKPQRVISPEVARAVRNMLVFAVESSSARRAAVPGIPLAGKTGTANIFDAEQGRYLEGEFAMGFAGIFPADNPRVTMVIYLKRPQIGNLSVLVITPIFHAIASETVALWGLPPQPTRLVQQR